MIVFRAIVAVLASLVLLAVLFTAVVNTRTAADTLSLAGSAVRGALGLLATYFVASLLLRIDRGA